MSVQTSMFGILWRLLQDYGHDPATLIAERLYRPGDPITEHSRISSREWYPLVGRTLDLIDDETAGIRAAQLLHPSHLGVFGHAWLSSPTLLTSVRMLERYGRVFNDDIRISVAEGPYSVRVTYERLVQSPYPEVNADMQLGGLIKFCRMQAGDGFVPLSVSLQRREPGSRKPWDDLFGVSVRFGSQENCVEIDADVASEIHSSAHSQMFETHHDMLARNIAALDETTVAERASGAIERLLPSAKVTEERVAKIVGMQSRTMHRRLSTEGVTFRALLRNVRMDLAKRYVGDPQYSVTEVAFMLGYSDVSAFSRAFRSWFGTTPSGFRASS